MTTKTNRLLHWVDARFPRAEVWRHLMTGYYAPKNLNFWYYFGVFSFLVLINQIITGIWLTMHYTPTAKEAFGSVEHIMRNVRFGWLLRYMHSTGASAFFVVIYLHMYRAIIYGSYKKPRELLWLFGMFLYVLLIAEAYTGYTLPWGQMSYWASKVVISLIQAVPLIGERLALWVTGDYNISGVTLHRFFAFHVSAIPMTIVIFVIFHIMALRKSGSNNPDGIEIKKTLDSKGHPVDGIPFHPYFTVKDLFGIMVFIFVFCTVMFFAPTMGGYFLEPDNFVQANPLVTPAHIAPVWYLAPFYAVLRAVPNKLLGIAGMAAGIAFLFVLPWLDRSPVKSIRYKGTLSKIAITVFSVSFIGLGYLGTAPASDIGTWMARVFSIGYFGFFLLMPFYTRLESTEPVPKSVTMK